MVKDKRFIPNIIAGIIVSIIAGVSLYIIFNSDLLTAVIVAAIIAAIIILTILYYFEMTITDVIRKGLNYFLKSEEKYTLLKLFLAVSTIPFYYFPMATPGSRVDYIFLSGLCIILLFVEYCLIRFKNERKREKCAREFIDDNVGQHGKVDTSSIG